MIKISSKLYDYTNNVNYSVETSSINSSPFNITITKYNSDNKEITKKNIDTNDFNEANILHDEVVAKIDI